uniref:NAD-dependent dihydropyrimidine dehydrogenase subunit PreA n=1 Tax=Anaerococcus mediterraneensis TaxID=1870984 RepID=UPI0009319414|nr:NAD-dependent dihydropyrimidine dehydrogenase subunit PreA [Anaerococcus mediterraneensis]
MAVKKDLSIDFLGVKCENPFFLSSSPVGSNYEMIKKAFEAGWAGVYYKTIGVYIPDECSPRFDIGRKEDLAWTGFKNMEMISDKPLELNLEYISRLKKDYPTKVMAVSIMGSNDEEWIYLTKKVTEAGADIIELNFSCPQMDSHEMGSDVGQNPELVAHYTKLCVENTHLPVVAKMTPNIGHMEIPAEAAVKAGAKGIAAINTIKAITNLDLESMTAMPAINGKSSISGYSGAAVKPIALRFITQMKQYEPLKDVPITGMGGIETWQDALEFLLVGASNLQVTTAVMQYGYRIVEDMISGLSHYMDERGIDRLEDLVGLALPNIVGADEIDRDFKIIPEINYDKCVKCGRCYVSCFDAAHQAIDWDSKERKPIINDNCVGCHLCLNVCPVFDCILPGEVKFKEGREEYEVKVKHEYR